MIGNYIVGCGKEKKKKKDNIFRDSIWEPWEENLKERKI